MSKAWAPLAALTLVGCGQPAETGSPAVAAKDWCEEYYATFDISNHIDPRTGRVRRSSLTQREEDCVRRESQKAIDRFEGNSGG